MSKHCSLFSADTNSLREEGSLKMPQVGKSYLYLKLVLSFNQSALTRQSLVVVNLNYIAVTG